MKKVTDRADDYGKAIADAAVELGEAARKFPPFHSAHEGFAILKEEVDELWEEVRAKQGARNMANLRKEAIQVAAMALRFAAEVTDDAPKT